MDSTIRCLIEAVHHAPSRCVLAVTGGGASAAGLLLSVPGGSRTVLEVVVPYHDQALCDFLGRRPEQFCSTETARDMAVRACERARWLAPGETVVGVGCTASLASDRPKRGDHRLHVATYGAQHTATYSLTLTKGAQDREAEEAVVAAVLLNAVAEAFGVAERLALPLLPGEEVQTESVPPRDVLSAFLRGEVPTVCAEVDGRLRADAPRPAVLLPGAFNPLHEGHCGMAAVAARLVGGSAAFELSVANVDKPPLAVEEVRRRLAQFTWLAPLWLTRAPTFAEKAALFPGVVFAVGADTAARIVAPRYYGDSAERMAEALDFIRGQGCRFLVAGRVDKEGKFVGLDNLSLPPAYRDLFTAIPEAEFRLDLSSTQLREQAERALVGSE
jgi:nicotinamide mononucleotide (NMN) deamidase PncC